MGKKQPPQPLTADEVKQLINACSPKCPTGLRNRALIALLHQSGLRISEALALLPHDIDTHDQTLTVRHGKGDKRRVVSVGESALLALSLWMAERTRLGIGPKQPVLCTLKGHPVKTAYIRCLLPRLATKAGISKRVHAHGLRHTHAVALVRQQQPIDVIKGQLGHSCIATTARYVDHLCPAERLERLKGIKWE